MWKESRTKCYTRALKLEYWGGPDKWVGLADFFVYHMKNNGEGAIFFCLLYKKQGEGVKISEIKKAGIPFY